MEKKLYEEKDLPWADLEKLGLASQGKLLMSQADQDALLSGRRSSLQKLSDIGDSHLHISEIDVKLSLTRDDTGKLQLRAHPINRYAEAPEGLEQHEAAQLISGEKMSIYKKLKEPEINSFDAIFEYDPETREFIKTDPQKITVPERVNGEELSASQREQFRKGEVVEINDGTKFRYTGVDPEPLRADRMLLIASILIDGGLTYVAYHGLKTLAGLLNKDPKATQKTEAYLKTEAEMQSQKAAHQFSKTEDSEQSRSYTRSGRSR
ncbi:DUF4099 domain-containing protein [Pedobacter sp. GR22-6]|uniref:DUF4099 domain-containing protein n=1 Tax=Pedobacter sp. GR22-6 TaxID=3127957 RepID=UPI00307EF580